MGKTVSKIKGKKKKKNKAPGGIAAFRSFVHGVVSDMLSATIVDIKDFNLMNYEFMQWQMSRNLATKEAFMEFSGSSAYIGGNSENHSEIPQFPSYTNGFNYLEYSDVIPQNEYNGVLTAIGDVDYVDESDKQNVFNKVHYYWDAYDGEALTDDHQAEDSVGVVDGGSYEARNSLLYKTRKLMDEGKIKTIVSKFHTDSDVFYNGQVRTNAFGESHGRNLLTKEAEKNGVAYTINGFDNPYCRVWTHHYQYDRFLKTMRADTGGINTWEGFEWTEDEKKIFFPEFDKEHGEHGEQYAYAWRGDHNQSRRRKHSVLDTETGLLKIAPKYLDGGSSNVHTKDCMFSIENLAWKDYDPYSFEQALSWEQRGPLGGRIMWFPPYGLTFTETASANWQQNDFIGRGEKIYTYVNSERSGNLSFMMITDHPSSIDYSSWYVNDDDKENDYHRYFAGCMGQLGMHGEGGVNDENTRLNNSYPDNIHEQPTDMTDEYTADMIKDIEINPNIAEKGQRPPENPELNENPITIEFFVFFPNNYSGINDFPNNKDGNVDAMLYLIAGRNSQVTTKKKIAGGDEEDGYIYDILHSDNPLTKQNFNEAKKGRGYETSTPSDTNSNNQIINVLPNTKGITDESYEDEFIFGAKKNYKESYQADENKQWWYRIDHILDNDGEYVLRFPNKNYIAQTLEPGKLNYQDTRSYGLNNNVSNNDDVHMQMDDENDELYSFLEVAAALYDLTKAPVDIYSYITGMLDNDSIDRIELLKEYFKDHKLIEVKCEGMSNSHGKDAKEGNARNNALAENRAKTIVTWLKTYSKWNEGDYKTKIGYTSSVPVPPGNVNDSQAKLYRCARCVMKFSAAKDSSTNSEDSNTTKTLENDYYRSISEWNKGTTYNTGDVVAYNKKVYSCNQDNVTSKPTTQKWTNITNTTSEWRETSTYQTGAIVLYQGTFFTVKQEVHGTNPLSGNGADYNEFNGFIRIDDNSEVKSVFPEADLNKQYYRKILTKPSYEQQDPNNPNSMTQQVNLELIKRCHNIWVYDDGKLQLMCDGYEPGRGVINSNGQFEFQKNKLRYDQEYHFYKRYFADHPFVFQKLQEKIKYFNPAFHSMTPEGFNSRLTFLHQCTRQGMTKTMGDYATGGMTANNLAFGRPPFCVLRLGDFYNQMIVIDNISFDYSVSDGISWDLNTEGNGVQPMLCKVNISFKFIGGGDITGPVRRLQNAMSFNYYANTSFYDNRADRVEYQTTNYKSMGGAGNNKVDLDNSYAYVPKIYRDEEVKSKP